jgi:uncharacterized OB-fold protein
MPDVRPWPHLDEQNSFYWTGGAEGELRLARCQQCGLYLHPPQPLCRRCLSTDIAVEAVSGKGRVFSFTLNYQPWIPDLELPYNIALVELVEQPSVRITTNIVGCADDEVYIGMPVKVTFRQVRDAWLPFFEPEET